MELIVQPLDRSHDRAAFSCGEASVDRFLKELARKRGEIHAAITMVAVQAEDTKRILGFYTLVPHEFRGDELPDVFRKQTGAGNLRSLPGVLLAQLGIDTHFQGQGIGSTLVRHALGRCARLAREFGAVAIVTDPINEQAERLYASFAFQPLVEGERRMIIAIKKILAAINGYL